MKILEIIGKGLLLSISFLCLFVSPAAFTPAVFLSFALMPVAGAMAFYGHINFSILILCSTSIAIVLSPITEIIFESMINALMALTPVILGYGGVMLGVQKLQRHDSIT
jgi:hypothetical protein